MCLKLLQDSCSEAMIRLFVFLLNVIFIVVGIVFAIAGIWMEVVYAYIENITGNKFAATPIAIGLTGLLTLVIASFGLWGIIRKSKCLTGTYATSLIVILIVQMAVIVAPIVARDETETVITKTANKTITEWEKPGGPIATSWDYIQRKFECCGVTEYQDWQNAPLFVNYAQNRSSVENPVPDSCCQDESELCGLTYADESDIYQEGCILKIESWFNAHNLEILGVIAGLCALEIITMILSCWLVRSGFSYEMIA